jgi:hypothetical protein
MPFNQNDHSFFNAVPGEIKMPHGLYDYHGSYWFEETYFPVDARGNRYIDPGLVVAVAVMSTDVTYGDVVRAVPYNADGSYGTGSDTAVGLLDIRLNATLQAEGVGLLYHGQVRQRNCYVLGQTKGVISAAVKTALSDVDWV